MTRKLEDFLLIENGVLLIRVDKDNATKKGEDYINSDSSNDDFYNTVSPTFFATYIVAKESLNVKMESIIYLKNINYNYDPSHPVFGQNPFLVGDYYTLSPIKNCELKNGNEKYTTNLMSINIEKVKLWKDKFISLEKNVSENFTNTFLEFNKQELTNHFIGEKGVFRADLEKFGVAVLKGKFSEFFLNNQKIEDGFNSKYIFNPIFICGHYHKFDKKEEMDYEIYLNQNKNIRENENEKLGFILNQDLLPDFLKDELGYHSFDLIRMGREINNKKNKGVNASFNGNNTDLVILNLRRGDDIYQYVECYAPSKFSTGAHHHDMLAMLLKLSPNESNGTNLSEIVYSSYRILNDWLPKFVSQGASKFNYCEDKIVDIVNEDFSYLKKHNESRAYMIKKKSKITKTGLVSNRVNQINNRK